MNRWLIGLMIGSLVAGCVGPEPVPDQPYDPESSDRAGADSDGRLPSRDGAVIVNNWTRISAIDCIMARVSLPSHPLLFPFPPPENWPDARQIQGARFDLQVYSCATVLVGSEHVFENASFAWESHTNLSWKENPEFDSNSLDALLGFYVDDHEFASVLERRGLAISRAQVTLVGGLTDPVATIASEETRIELSLTGYDYSEFGRTSTVHVVPEDSTGEWLRIDSELRVEKVYGPWRLEAEGESATAEMLRSVPGLLRSTEGSAAEATLDILWEAGFQ